MENSVLKGSADRLDILDKIDQAEKLRARIVHYRQYLNDNNLASVGIFVQHKKPDNKDLLRTVSFMENLDPKDTGRQLFRDFLKIVDYQLKDLYTKLENTKYQL